MIRRLHSVVLIVGATASSAPFATAWAQGQGDASDTTKACTKAARTVENGHPAHKELAALNLLVNCGRAGATTTAMALTRSRLESDIDALTQFYYTVDQWRDADIMHAAIQLAGDPGAAVPARVFAVKHLLWLLVPGAAYSYEILTAGEVQVVSASAVTVTRPCRYGATSDNGATVGTPLPSGFDTQIKGVLGQLAADASVPGRLEMRRSVRSIDRDSPRE